MRKVTLDLDTLAVESFATHGDGKGEGTVVARSEETLWQTCPGNETCGGAQHT